VVDVESVVIIFDGVVVSGIGGLVISGGFSGLVGHGHDEVGTQGVCGLHGGFEGGHVHGYVGTQCG
jgi:hypothetical protein